jgi:hypothetical protein
MFDVFYQGPKPNLFPFEVPAKSLEEAAKFSRTKFFWFLDGNCDYTSFNFEYRSLPWEENFIHIWPNQWQTHSNTFLANKYTTANRQWHTKDDQIVKSLPNMDLWVIPDYIDRSNFDFSWQPNALEDDYVYYFGTQWQDTGGPVYNPTGTAGTKIINEPKAKTIANNSKIIYIDHGNRENSLDFLKQFFPQIRITRFIDSYLGTIKRVLNTIDSDYVWVINSICDYTSFDFSWHPEKWKNKMLHVFPSNGQSKGDTFYINVKEFKKQADKLELLDWFDTINYCDDQSLTRYTLPFQYYSENDLISTVKSHFFDYPYTLFSNQIIEDCPNDFCMWSLKNRTIVSLTRSNSVLLVPRDIKTYLETQIYDYPFISKQNQPVLSDKPLDIIYISNGEPDAELWYEHLLRTVSAAGATNWVRRVKDVNGRANAIRTAAEISQTDWFFAVPAKLKVSIDFDWGWQPDYLQEPKHYIFHSKNPVNGLEYGHMAAVAYNRQLTLETIEHGLDFTLSKPHAVIPVVSGTAHYNTTPELTWRTAFRECIKLFDDVQKNGSVESQYRLDCWLGEAKGEHSMWSLLGAKDAIDYWLTCEGKYEFLMLTFEWWWLKDYYAKIYTPNAKVSDQYIQESQIQPIQLPGQLALGK